MNASIGLGQVNPSIIGTPCDPSINIGIVNSPACAAWEAAHTPPFTVTYSGGNVTYAPAPSATTDSWFWVALGLGGVLLVMVLMK